MNKLIIATRQSKLALWQAHFVRDQLMTAHPGLAVELLGITTKGDRWLSSPLSQIGGKALFVKELEQALIDAAAHLCVHSMKDVPAVLPDGFELPVIGYRENPVDVLVSRGHERFDALPEGARVGSSSLRRASQLLHRRPDLRVESIRGNVETRLAKLDAGEFDAIVLARAGLVRLELMDRITEELAVELCLPSAGQGALGVETLADAEDVKALLEPLHNPTDARCVTAERGVSAGLGADCTAPVAAYAEPEGAGVRLRARVARADGSRVIGAEARGESPADVAAEVVAALLADGAEALLASGA